MNKSYSPSKEAKKVIDKIINHCIDLKLKTNNKGYLSSFEENLIQTYENWQEIKSELEAGQGNELKEDNESPKFKAVHSSSALCINTFAPFKQQKDKFNFLGYKNFSEATFEKKVPTGISTPNLDFYLENEKVIIGFESKFTEFITPKLPNKNLNSYFNNDKFSSFLDSKFNLLIQEYKDCKVKYHLDIAQLLKHSIGLLKKADKTKKPILIYIYWQPENSENFEIFQKHKEEIEKFKAKITKFIEFVPISYSEFWKMYENDKIFGTHIYKVIERYNLSL